MKFIWDVDKFIGDFRKDCIKRLTKVGIYLTSKIRTKLNRAQKYVRYSGGKYYRGLNPSKPGEYPKKLSGQLMKSITYKVDETNLVVQVGSSLKGYPLFLEVGTKFMKPRPWLSLTMVAEHEKIKDILTQ